jgi:nucleotide-binding universal stress UspA family protein
VEDFMHYKTILVYLSDDGENESRLEAAFALATQHQSHVVGLYTIAPLVMPGYAGVAIPQVVFDAHEREAQAAAALAEKSLLAAGKRAGFSHEWRLERGPARDVLRTHAIYADLVVIGPAARLEASEPGGLGAEIAISAGRPVLYVPAVWKVSDIGRRIMVAWNGSRQAARAVSDSLPLLKSAEEVFVISGAAKTLLPIIDLGTALARHGVKIEMQNIHAPSDTDLGMTLLREAELRRCDLLVMGIYGRSRVAELIFGGVSRHVLTHASLPLLFSS